MNKGLLAILVLFFSISGEAFSKPVLTVNWLSENSYELKVSGASSCPYYISKSVRLSDGTIKNYGNQGLLHEILGNPISTNNEPNVIVNYHVGSHNPYCSTSSAVSVSHYSDLYTPISTKTFTKKVFAGVGAYGATKYADVVLGKAYVFSKEPITKIEDPIIVVQWLELETDYSRTPFSFSKYVNDNSSRLFSELINNGETVILYAYGSSVQSVFTSSEGLESLLKDINTPNRIVGLSLGGLVAKYTLGRLDKSIHKTSHFVAIDSPLQGANLPQQLVSNLYQMYDDVDTRTRYVPGASVPYELRKIRDMLDSTAVKQVLTYHNNTSFWKEIDKYPLRRNEDHMRTLAVSNGCVVNRNHQISHDELVLSWTLSLPRIFGDRDFSVRANRTGSLDNECGSLAPYGLSIGSIHSRFVANSDIKNEWPRVTPTVNATFVTTRSSLGLKEGDSLNHTPFSEVYYTNGNHEQVHMLIDSAARQKINSFLNN